MRKFKTGLIALVASAAMLVPATAANASTQSVSNTASSSLTNGCVLVCFDLYTGDVLSGNDVDILNATIFCNNISLVNVLVNQEVHCGGGKKVKRTH
jgi:hypothetical protein